MLPGEVQAGGSRPSAGLLPCQPHLTQPGTHNLAAGVGMVTLSSQRLTMTSVRVGISADALVMQPRSKQPQNRFQRLLHQALTRLGLRSS